MILSVDERVFASVLSSRAMIQHICDVVRLMQAEEDDAEAQCRWQGACDRAAAARSDEADAAARFEAAHIVSRLLSGKATNWERAQLHLEPGRTPFAPLPIMLRKPNSTMPTFRQPLDRHETSRM